MTTKMQQLRELIDLNNEILEKQNVLGQKRAQFIKDHAAHLYDAHVTGRIMASGTECMLTITHIDMSIVKTGVYIKYRGKKLNKSGAVTNVHAYVPHDQYIPLDDKEPE